MAILTLVYLAYMTAGYVVLVLDLLPAYDRSVSYSLIVASFLFAVAILVFSLAKRRRNRENGEPEKRRRFFPVSGHKNPPPLVRKGMWTISSLSFLRSS